MPAEELNDYSFTYSINGKKKLLEAQAKSFKRGPHHIAFVNDIFNDDQMIEDGYLISRLPSRWFNKINTSITQYISNKINVSDSNFRLSNYHTYVDDALHKQVVDSFRERGVMNGIPLSELGVTPNEMDDFVNTEIKSKRRLSCNQTRDGITLDVFWIRIVRPQVHDNNPPHKDTHLPGIQKNINIYLPLAGSNRKSSLPLIPKSHNELESEYIVSSSPCHINGKLFTVPAIVHRNNRLEMTTPDPKEGEVMLFTPHLIHGGGSNDNQNTTRVSLEMRFF
jgi:hypothetical protein